MPEDFDRIQERGIACEREGSRARRISRRYGRALPSNGHGHLQEDGSLPTAFDHHDSEEISMNKGLVRSLDRRGTRSD